MGFNLKKDLYIPYVKKPLGIGGEVTNESDVPWLLSHGSNSNPKDFLWLPPGKNSDEFFKINDLDIDALWVYPFNRKVSWKRKSGKTSVNSGVFKLVDHRNVNISGSRATGYRVFDVSQHFEVGNYPGNWNLPPQNLIPKHYSDFWLCLQSQILGGNERK